MDLDTFAQHRAVTVRRCAVCNLPPDVLAQVNAALSRKVLDKDGKPIGRTVVSEWLKGEGHTISGNQLDHHRLNGHVDG